MRPLALALLVAAPWHARAYCINWGANCECPGACQACSEPAASGATQCASWNPEGILNSDGSLDTSSITNLTSSGGPHSLSIIADFDNR